MYSTSRNVCPREPSFTALKSTAAKSDVGRKALALPAPLFNQGHSDLGNYRVAATGGELGRRSWQAGVDSDDAAMKRLSLELNSLRMSGIPLESVARGNSPKPLATSVVAADADLLQWLDDCDFGDLGFVDTQ